MSCAERESVAPCRLADWSFQVPTHILQDRNSIECTATTEGTREAVQLQTDVQRTRLGVERFSTCFWVPSSCCAGCRCRYVPVLVLLSVSFSDCDLQPILGGPIKMAKLCAFLILASCTLVAAAPAAIVAQNKYNQLIKRVFFGDTTQGACAVNGSNYLDINLGPGSSATTHGNNMWTITDRGANIGCQGKDAPGGAAGVTLSKACQKTGCPDASNTNVYPIPDFAPTIQLWKLPDVFTGTPTPVATITMKKLNGQDITGLANFAQGDTISGNPNSNLLTGETDYGPDFQQLPYDAFGQDTEGLVVTSANADGSNAQFWVSEEYGPSVSKVGPDGRVMARHVPAGVVYDTYVTRAALQENGDPTNGYPFYPTFPEILVKRELNRGFESLAYFGNFLYAFLQSPMANPGEDIQAISRNIRVFKLELSDSYPGGAKCVGEFVYVGDDVATFPEDEPKADQSNIKLGDAEAIAEDVILVDEHVTLQTKIYRIELAGATNILGSKWDSLSQTPTLEQLGVAGPFGSSDTLEAEGIIPVTKVLSFDSFTDLPASGPQLPVKVESLSIFGNPFDTANPGDLILTNDNDFGISGAITIFSEVQVSSLVYDLCVPVFPKGGTCDASGSEPNQCFNNDGSLYTCCGSSGCPSTPGAQPFCNGQENTPVCLSEASTEAPPPSTGASPPTGNAPPPAAGPTALPPRVFPVGTTCNASSSLPNQCFAANGMTYTCCPGACGSPSGDTPFCG